MKALFYLTKCIVANLTNTNIIIKHFQIGKKQK